MPIRFRRTFTIFPGVKVNVSKGGVSFTVGPKGYHLNFSKRGVKQTMGLPGSGLSYTSYLGKDDSDSETENEKEKDTTASKRRRTSDNDEKVVETREAESEPRRRSPGWILLLGVVVIYLGALILGLIPTNFLSQVLHTLLEWTRSIGL